MLNIQRVYTSETEGKMLEQAIEQAVHWFAAGMGIFLVVMFGIISNEIRSRR